MAGRKKKVVVELTPAEKQAKTELHNQCKLIISFFLRDPALCNWPNEIKNAKELLAMEKPDFWYAITKLENKLNSLVFFKTEDGKKHIELQRQKMDFTFEVPKKFEISSIKVGENKIIEKPKSLLENLSNKNNN